MIALALWLHVAAAEGPPGSGPPSLPSEASSVVPAEERPSDTQAIAPGTASNADQHEDDTSAPATTAVPASSAEATPKVLTTAERLQLAYTRLEDGDPEGARVVLDPLLADPPADLDAAEARYLHALALERVGQVAEAEAAHMALIADLPGSSRATDAAFRLAEIAWRGGDPVEARARLAGMPPVAGAAATQVALADGVFLLQSGERDAGRAAIEATLAAALPDEATLWQAHARAALLRADLEDAATISIRGSTKRQTRALEARAKALVAGESAVIQIIESGHTEPILLALLALGEGYELLGDALLTAPPPRKLNAEQTAIYQELLAEKAALVYVKAGRHHQAGLDFVDRRMWRGPGVASLREALARTTAKAEAIPVGAP